MKKNKIVYSTDPDWESNCDECGLPESECICNNSQAVPTKQNLRVSLEKKGRKGKSVTVIKGFVGDIKNMQKKLQQICGTGGSAKDDNMELQGDHRKKIIEYFQKEGHIIKQSGG